MFRDSGLVVCVHTTGLKNVQFRPNNHLYNLFDRSLDENEDKSILL